MNATTKSAGKSSARKAAQKPGAVLNKTPSMGFDVVLSDGSVAHGALAKPTGTELLAIESAAKDAVRALTKAESKAEDASRDVNERAWTAAKAGGAWYGALRAEGMSDKDASNHVRQKAIESGMNKKTATPYGKAIRGFGAGVPVADGETYKKYAERVGKAAGDTAGGAGGTREQTKGMRAKGLRAAVGVAHDLYERAAKHGVGKSMLDRLAAFTSDLEAIAVTAEAEASASAE